MSATPVVHDLREARSLLEMVEGRKLVQPGDQLRYVRRAKGEVHTARVLEDDQLKLADGTRHRTPPAAVRAACDGKVSEGWRTWRRVKDGRTLLELCEDANAGREIQP
ncbi:restriction system modified-DNA reader domain-containing protein [Amycolatopsis echigonensis]|uniref:RAMA domain-containing protein n=1 Tax=Amycolatopsis echigonensis TaxID=2576905 RepID=A0A8E1VYA1_9PSEU|nr:hypothetical protein [Amycolatopsis echigonensis]MBB2500421.1 hypothetical protein [Amycolatopsis echigonensis]